MTRAKVISRGKPSNTSDPLVKQRKILWEIVESLLGVRPTRIWAQKIWKRSVEAADTPKRILSPTGRSLKRQSQ
ncbi:hypothetical protein L596_008878 [Steinernema carpocapsae]|uniref:Uncharacterized protein n=1 Tax=Steinernema carpocapsae TaxID=34508 RepID=A0A4V6A6H1_STECR|nr:hypothetical protein L596_008878 [Steinernema carpocapsae]